MADDRATDDEVVDPARGNHFAGMSIGTVLGYLRHRGGDELVAQVIDRAGFGPGSAEALDEMSWCSCDEFRALLAATVDVTGDPTSLFAAGSHIYEALVHPEYAEMVRAFGSPAALSEHSAELNTMFTTIVELDAEVVSPNEVCVEQRFLPGFEPFKHYCDFYRGLMTASPRLFGFPMPEVVEEACQADGDEVCRLRMTWEDVDDAQQRIESLDFLTKVLSARLAGLQRTVTELASSDDLDGMLDLIVTSAARAVTAPAYVLALQQVPAATRRVYAMGVDDGRAAEIATRLLAGAGDQQDGAGAGGMLVADVASAHMTYGRLAAVDPEGRRQYLAEELPVLQAYASIAAAALDTAIALDDARRQATAAQAMAELLADEQALLAGIVDGLPHGVAWADTGGTLVGCNQALVQLLGYRSIDDVVGLGWDRVCPDQAASELLTRWIDDLAVTRAPMVNRELVIRVAGEQRMVLVSAVPLDSHDGTGRVLSIWADVTEQRTIEQRLAETSRLESIGQLAAGVAHEINTPMQYIGDNGRFLGQGFERLTAAVGELIDVAASHGADPEALGRIRSKAKLDLLAAKIPEAVGEISEGVRAVSQIVRSMKTFAHPGGVDFEAVDLNEIIESTVVMSHHEWKQRAELELDVPDDLPPVRAVPGMINQVVLNLIVNAAHAVAERHGGQDSDGGSGSGGGGGGGGGGSIRVSAEVAGKEIELRVTDNGGGIPESIRGKVYDQFFTTKSVGRGTGQGLAICRNIISRHEGSIGFTTSESGTTFTVRLPRWIQRSDDHDGPAAR